MSISNIGPTSGPTNAYHIARAYAALQASPARTSGTQTSETQAQAPQRTPSAVQRLIAGVVPGGVDFGAEATPTQLARGLGRGDEAGGPSKTPGTSAAGGFRPSESAPLAFYRHPADKNAAATGVSVGRTLDVQG